MEQGFADRERSVWRAVIAQALMDAGSKSSKREAIRAKRDALEWLYGNNQDFETVCELSDYEPSYIRRKAAAAKIRNFMWRLPAGQGYRVQARLNNLTKENLNANT